MCNQQVFVLSVHTPAFSPFFLSLFLFLNLSPLLHFITISKRGRWDVYQFHKEWKLSDGRNPLTSQRHTGVFHLHQHAISVEKGKWNYSTVMWKQQEVWRGQRLRHIIFPVLVQWRLQGSNSSLFCFFLFPGLSLSLWDWNMAITCGTLSPPLYSMFLYSDFWQRNQRLKSHNVFFSFSCALPSPAPAIFPSAPSASAGLFLVD